jgi:hypothetical protein
LVVDITAELNYAIGDFVGENSKPLLCRLQDGLVIHVTLTIIMCHGDLLMRRVNIIDRVVEAGLYIYWVSLEFNWRKVSFSKIAIFHQLAGYYSIKFNPYKLFLSPFDWLVFMCNLLYFRSDVQSRIKLKLFEVDKGCFI